MLGYIYLNEAKTLSQPPTLAPTRSAEGHFQTVISAIAEKLWFFFSSFCFILSDYSFKQGPSNYNTYRTTSLN